VRGGVLEAARVQVENHHLLQQVPQTPQVARVPGPGQRRGAHPLGSGQIAGLDQHGRQDVAAHPGRRAVPAGRHLLRVPGQLHGAVAVAGDTGDQAEDRQGQRFSDRLVTLTGQGQGTAGIVGRLGDPAHGQPLYWPSCVIVRRLLA
jgi:hypothetical protein